MATSLKKTTVQRPASATPKPMATTVVYELPRPVAPMPVAATRGSAKSTKSERRRSMPASSDVLSVSDTDGPPRSRPHPPPVSTVSLYERRRASGVMSPTLTVSSAMSIRSDNGPDRSSRDRSKAASVASATAADEALSIHRLRSNSGLSLHTNSSALRRYTDYNVDGTTRLPPTDERFDADELLSGSTAAPALFSWDTVHAVLDDPMSRHRMWEYTRVCGGAENLDFLEKVEQYNKALHSVTAIMANISTTFTCVTASEPLNLPPHLARALNTDVKHVSSSILPGLGMLFGDVDAHVKERILRQIYPGFVKRQLGFRMKAALGAPSANAAQTPFRFEGLGHAFCLTDPYRPDNPVVYASDGFARALGYARSEDIPRSGRFFRGPKHTDEEKFAEELVLSRNRRDNHPFWSLVSACPLKTASGRVRFVLSGLVDVSDAVKSTDDIVHALSAVPPTPCHPSSTGSVSSFGSTGSVNNAGRTGERPSSAIMGSNDVPSRPPPSRSDKTSKSFFKPFSRRRRADDTAHHSSSRSDKTSPAVSPPAELSPRFPQPVPRPREPEVDDKLAIYSRFMVLQFVPGSSRGPDGPPPMTRRNSRYGNNAPAPSAASGSVARLKVAFSSLPALELLGLGPAAQEAVMYHDVFSVLSELAGSPSITPVFRAQVRQRVVSSEPASLELAIPASGVPAPGAFSAGLGAGLASPMPGGDDLGMTTSRRSSLLLSGRAKPEAPDDEAGHTSPESKLSIDGWWAGASSGRRRRSGTFDRPPTADWKNRDPPKMQRLMSHWTPLKDVDGTVAWVILVISPVVEQ